MAGARLIKESANSAAGSFLKNPAAGGGSTPPPRLPSPPSPFPALYLLASNSFHSWVDSRVYWLLATSASFQAPTCFESQSPKITNHTKYRQCRDEKLSALIPSVICTQESSRGHSVWNERKTTTSTAVSSTKQSRPNKVG